jgi:hypothetical protein
MHVIRSSANPIIRPHMDDRMGDNVNGPSLIRMPDWVTAPLGRYYLYFAHHDGRYIRLAYADDLDGPWKIHRPGVLSLADARFILARRACRSCAASNSNVFPWCGSAQRARSRTAVFAGGPIVRWT